MTATESGRRAGRHPILPADLTDGYVRDGLWRGDTIGDVVAVAAEQDPDAPAVVGDEVLTVGELHDQARRIAGHLEACGVRPGDRLVAVLAYDAHAVVTTVASSMLGTQLVGVAPEQSPQRIAALVARITPGALVLDVRGRGAGPMLDALGASLDGFGPGRVVVVGDADPTPASVPFATVSRSGPPLVGVRGVASACSVLIPTGGTTGEPKLVQQHDNSLLYSSRHTVAAAAIGPDDVYLGVGPFGHIMTYFATYIALASGAALVPCPGWRRGTEAVVPATRTGATVSMMTSTHAYDLLMLPEDGGDGLATLTLVMSAGKPDEFFAAIEARYGFRMMRLYGLSEVGTHVHVDITDLDAGDADGLPLPGTTARIADPETGEPRPVGEPGEYQVQGPSMCLGYHERPDATAQSLTEDGFWRTGDLATIDERGYVRICGRLKDSIRRGGITITPDEMESLLFAHPAITEGCVIGTPDPRLGQIVNAVVVLGPDASVGLDELREYLLANGIPKKELPDRLFAVESIPRTDLGRLSKRHLLDQLDTAIAL